MERQAERERQGEESPRKRGMSKKSVHHAGPPISINPSLSWDPLEKPKKKKLEGIGDAICHKDYQSTCGSKTIPHFTLVISCN